MGYDEVISKVEKYSQLVVEKYHPQMIVLYGSYSKGTAKEDSDIDVAVVFDKILGDYFENSAELFKLRRQIDLRIEPLLLTTGDNSRFYNEIINTGKMIYRG